MAAMVAWWLGGCEEDGWMEYYPWGLTVMSQLQDYFLIWF